MTTYSDEKNPYKIKRIKARKLNRLGYLKYHIREENVSEHRAWQEGYLAAEKKLAFTEEEIAVFKDMQTDHNPDLETWSGDLVQALESLEKKVIGEE